MGQNMISVIFKICMSDVENSYRNPDAVINVINYVLRDGARKNDNLWGSIGTYNKSKDGIIKDFYKIKRLYDKDEGVQVKHLILSWGKRPDIPRKKMRKLLKQTVGFWGSDCQAVYAVHEDKGDCGYHMHIVLNSVSNYGHKIQITGKRLKRFRRKFNCIWNSCGYKLDMKDK